MRPSGTRTRSLEPPLAGGEGGVATDPTREPDGVSVPQACETGARTGQRSASGNRGSRAVPNPEILLGELKGARVQGQVMLAEELANRALSEALQSARHDTARQGATEAGVARRGAAQTGIERSTVASWIQRANVRFVNGRMVLDVDVVIT